MSTENAHAHLRLANTNGRLYVLPEGWEPPVARFVLNAPRPLAGEPLDTPLVGFTVDSTNLTTEQVEDNLRLDARLITFHTREDALVDMRRELAEDDAYDYDEIMELPDSLLLASWASAPQNRIVKI